MLETLKFIKGSVAKKDFVPALQHFRIKDHTIQGYNGAISLSSPIDLNLECNPRADLFIKAISSCEGTVQMHLTPTGRLAVQSGDFSVFVPCLPQEEKYPNIEPEGAEIQMDGAKLMDALEILQPFIAIDASRPWARGVLFRGPSAFATNNIILIEKWIGVAFPEINIPADSVNELLRIGQAPIKIQASSGSVTFHFPGGRWLRSQLLSTEWPNVAELLNKEGGKTPIPHGFFKDLEKLLPFINDFERCYFTKDKMSTEATEADGAAVALVGIPEKGSFNLKQLLLLRTVAQTCSFESYPEPSLFYGDSDTIRGVIVGMYT